MAGRFTLKKIKDCLISKAEKNPNACIFINVIQYLLIGDMIVDLTVDRILDFFVELLTLKYGN